MPYTILLDFISLLYSSYFLNAIVFCPNRQFLFFYTICLFLFCAIFIDITFYYIYNAINAFTNRKERSYGSNSKHSKSGRRKKSGTQSGHRMPQGTHRRDRKSTVFPGPDRHPQPDQGQALIPPGDLKAAADPAVLRGYAHPLSGGRRAHHYGKSARNTRLHASIDRKSVV